MLDLKHETLSELQPSHQVFEELSNVNKAIGVGLFTNLYQYDTNIYETPLKYLTKIYPHKWLQYASQLCLAANVVLKDTSESHTRRPP